MFYLKQIVLKSPQSKYARRVVCDLSVRIQNICDTYISALIESPLFFSGGIWFEHSIRFLYLISRISEMAWCSSPRRSGVSSSLEFSTPPDWNVIKISRGLHACAYSVLTSGLQKQVLYISIIQKLKLITFDLSIASGAFNNVHWK